MSCLIILYPFNFFKGYLPQILEYLVPYYFMLCILFVCISLYFMTVMIIFLIQFCNCQLFFFHSYLNFMPIQIHIRSPKQLILVLRRKNSEHITVPFYCAFTTFPFYGISLRIHSECAKIRTRKNPNADTFHVVFLSLKHLQLSLRHP